MKQYFSQRLPLTVLVLLFLSLPLFAQDVRVSITLRDASLKELFRAIEEQTSYSFSYSFSYYRTYSESGIQEYNSF